VSRLNHPLVSVGATVLLVWGAETAEKDVPRSFAIENVTGANGILIGIGWAGIAAFTVWRAATTRDTAVKWRDGLLADVVELDRDIAVELTCLFLVTIWAFFVPLGGGIGAIDTLFLIGTISVVYSLGLGRYGVLPFDSRQAAETWITAGQSFFALSVLRNFEISLWEATGLSVLFISQVLLEFTLIRDLIVFPISSHDLLLVYTGVYILLGVGLFAIRRHALAEVLGLAADALRTAVGREPRGISD
jgi:hypothetical protein